MPELPEVETIRRQLRPALVGMVVQRGWSFPSAKFDAAPEAAGFRIRGLRRRGKYLIAELGPEGPVDHGAGTLTDRELIVHLGMTGRLTVLTPEEHDPAHPHLRASWQLGGSALGPCEAVLAFHDPRRFGRVAVVRPGDYGNLPTLDGLGPEPWDDGFDAAALRAGLTGRRAVKTVLLSQRVVAGVGNIYADEALWLAGIDPRRRTLGTPRARVLRDAVRSVLEAGIHNGGTTLRDYRDAGGAEGSNQHRLNCYGRAGSPCPRCGSSLRRTLVDARTTTWCPRCQR